MVDKNSTISQILAENPGAIDIFNSYGIPCYVDNILNDVNSNGNNSGLY